MVFKHMENEARKERVLEATYAVNPMTQPPLRVLVTQSCPTLCNAMDCSSPSSSVYGILQATHFRLEWVAIPFSRGSVVTQGSKLGLLHCRHILYHLSHQGSLQEIQKGEEKIEGEKKKN